MADMTSRLLKGDAEELTIRVELSLSTLRDKKNFERILFSWTLDFTFCFFVVLKETFVTVRCGRLCLKKNSG